MRSFEPASLIWTARALFLLRVVTAFVFIAHGTAKLFGHPVGDAPSPPPHFLSETWFAGILETFGGAAVMVGLFTRPVAFILSGQMAVAYFQFHFSRSFWPTLNGGESAVLYCFIFLYIAFAGPGSWSLDQILWRRRTEAGGINGAGALN